MNYMNSMPYQTPSYTSNQNRGLVPLVIGGAIGYGLGANSRPNFVPVPVFPIGPAPIFRPRPVPYWSSPMMVIPFRKR